MKKGVVLSLMRFFLDERADCFKQNANFVPLNLCFMADKATETPLMKQYYSPNELEEHIPELEHNWEYCRTPADTSGELAKWVRIVHL